LQYYSLPENLLTPTYYENNIFPFSLIVSGRTSISENSSDLEQLVGTVAHDIFATNIGCGQLVFVAKQASLVNVPSVKEKEKKSSSSSGKSRESI